MHNTHRAPAQGLVNYKNQAALRSGIIALGRAHAHITARKNPAIKNGPLSQWQSNYCGWGGWVQEQEAGWGGWVQEQEAGWGGWVKEQEAGCHHS